MGTVGRARDDAVDYGLVVVEEVLEGGLEKALLTSNLAVQYISEAT